MTCLKCKKMTTVFHPCHRNTISTTMENPFLDEQYFQAKNPLQLVFLGWKTLYSEKPGKVDTFFNFFIFSLSKILSSNIFTFNTLKTPLPCIFDSKTLLWRFFLVILKFIFIWDTKKSNDQILFKYLKLVLTTLKL